MIKPSDQKEEEEEGFEWKTRTIANVAATSTNSATNPNRTRKEPHHE